MRSRIPLVVLLALPLLLQACAGEEPVAPERYAASDGFVGLILENIAADPGLQLVADIDHSRLGHEAGSPMPPSRVLIFSDRQLESELIKLEPLAALDLPLRLLSFESGEGGTNRVIYNSFDYLESRYGLEGDGLAELATRYQEGMDRATSGLPQESIARFADNAMQPDGIITIDSPYDFKETVARVRAAIDAQSDTVYFGEVDFQENAREQGIELPPSYMILFGGPGPGGKAMAGSPTLGLDGFCQKFLIWQDEQGQVHLSFNDLIALARRQDVDVALALRVINFRLNSVFDEALAPE